MNGATKRRADVRSQRPNDRGKEGLQVFRGGYQSRKRSPTSGGLSAKGLCAIYLQKGVISRRGIRKGRGDACRRRGVSRIGKGSIYSTRGVGSSRYRSGNYPCGKATFLFRRGSGSQSSSGMTNNSRTDFSCYYMLSTGLLRTTNDGGDGSTNGTTRPRIAIIV